MALYTVRNYASVATHYAATAGVAVGSVALGMSVIGIPWVMLGAGVLVGGLSYGAIRVQKKLFEQQLAEHPKTSPHAQRLGLSAEELYKASGLTSENYPIYDFRVAESPVNTKAKDKKAFEKLFGDMMKKMAQVHNAAAVHLGKPVIMISEPLLKLLDDKEEKAVLAHEFAHAAARHSAVGLPQQVVLGASGLINSITRIVGIFGAGLVGVGTAFLARACARIGFNVLGGHSKLLDAEDDQLSLPELAKKKKVTAISAAVGTVAFASTIAAFYPAFVPVFAAATGLGVAGALIRGTFSRSNEYQADRGAVELGGDPLALMTSLRKMEIVHKRSLEEAFKGDVPKKGFLKKAWQRATATHPPTPKRIERLAKIAKKKGYTEEEITAAAKGELVVGAEHNMPFKVIDAMVRGL